MIKGQLYAPPRIEVWWLNNGGEPAVDIQAELEVAYPSPGDTEWQVERFTYATKTYYKVKLWDSVADEVLHEVVVQQGYGLSVIYLSGLAYPVLKVCTVAPAYNAQGNLFNLPG